MNSDVVAAPKLYFGQLSSDQIRAFCAAAVGYALEGYDFVIITLVLSRISAEFHLKLGAAGSLISAMFLARWLSGGVLGWVGDRFGRRTGMMASILLYAGGTMLCGLATGFWMLFLFRILVGIGVAGEYATSVTYVLETWPPHWRNRATAFLIATFYIGSAVAAQVFIFVVPHFGWRAMFFTGAIPILLAVYIRHGIIESPEWIAAAAEKRSSTRHRLQSVISASNFKIAAIMIVIAFATFIVSQTPKSFLPTLLAHRGNTPAVIGNLTTLLNITTAVSMCLLGIVADWIGTKRTLLFVYPIGAISLLVTFLPGAPTLQTTIFAIILMGATQQTVAAIIPNYISHFFDTAIRCLGLGVILNLGSLGGSFGPSIAGYFGQSIGLSSGTLYTVEAAIVLLFVLIATLPDKGEALH